MVADEAGGQDEQSAHRGRAGFFLMALRNFGADRLADMRRAKSLNQQRTRVRVKRQRRQPGQHGAEGFVAQNIERWKPRVKRIEWR